MTATTCAPPQWFQRAIGEQPEHRDIVAGRTKLHYRSWGNRELPAVILVHGAGGNSSWWDHVGPLLVGHHVIAPDLSGHGDSDYRNSYELEVWADELVAIIAAEKVDRPVVIGHSLGGRVAVTGAVDHPWAVRGVVCIDTPLIYRPQTHEVLPDRNRRHRVYATADDAIERFRTLPPQETILPYVGRHIAAESLEQVEGGWTWKFDPSVFRRRPSLEEALGRLSRPTVLLRCEKGVVPTGMAVEMQRLASLPLSVIELPGSGHHPMLDQPRVLLSVLSNLLDGWPRA